MRPLPLVLVASCLATAFACEERFSASPPVVSPGSLPPAPSDGIDALLAPLATDAGPVARDASHAMTVTLCSASPDACATGDAEAPGDGAYRVVFGSGRGVVRSRGQAMADLYKELRDRTGSGERIAVETRARGDGGVPFYSGRGPTKPTGDADPLSQCAFELVDLVDGVGGVVLDVVHSSGGCKVSLGQAIGDGGSSRCLVQGDRSERRPGR